MTDEAANLVLEQLRLMRADIASIKEDIREVKTRLTQLEATTAYILQSIGHLAGSIAGQQASHDRLAQRVERIERRLELNDDTRL